MQPDPVMLERQKQEQLIKQQRAEQIRVTYKAVNFYDQKRKEDEMTRQQMMQEQEHQRAEMLEAQKNEWDELSDYENMVDERQLEPDYYIDRPVSLSDKITALAFSDFCTECRRRP